MTETKNTKEPEKRGPGRPPKKAELQKPEAKEKTCNICGGTFPATKEHFRGHSATSDGLENRCRGCVGKKGNIMELDFSEHTALLEKLERLAFAEYRTPELQIMAMISKEE